VVLYENWEWTGDKKGSGSSIIEEVKEWDPHPPSPYRERSLAAGWIVKHWFLIQPSTIALIFDL
jgi:hypothetical protein